MKKLVALIIVVCALVAPQLAMANSTVLGSYGSNSAKPVLKAQAVKHVSKAQAAVASAQRGKTLPFTGVDLAVVSIAGIALLGLGFGLRRMGRDRS